MKQLILIAAIMLMAGVVHAGDPNTMATPTMQNTVTANFEHNVRTLTIKMKFDKDTWDFITNSGGTFEPYVKKSWYGGITSFYRRWKAEQMNKLTAQQIIEAVNKAEQQ